MQLMQHDEKIQSFKKLVMSEYGFGNEEYGLKEGEDLLAFNFYLKDYHHRGFLNQGMMISNPFLSTRQSTPSFNLYKSRSGKWKYKDFATADKGDVYDLVKNLFKLRYGEARQKIRTDLQDILTYSKNEANECKSKISTIKNKINNKMISQENNNEYTISTREFIDADGNFWYKKYGITRETLIRYKVSAITSFVRNGNLITPDDIAYAYDIGEGYKIYQPTDKKYKFQFIGSKPQNFIFGYEQLPESSQILFITGGEKDVLTLAAKGFNAICLNSETASLPNWLYEDLKVRFENIIILYDNDKTGMEQSEKLCQEHKFERLILPNMENGKDVSDYISLEYSINALLNFQLPKMLNTGYSVSSFRDLSIIGDSLPPTKKIWGCFVLEGSLILFPAERGIGKTFLMLELAMLVANQAESFCGEVIELHGNTLYINLELSDVLMSRRIRELEKNIPINNHQYQAHCLTISGNLEKQLPNVEKIIAKLNPVLIIIDNMRAASSHIDNEKNKAVVNFIQSLQKLIAKYKCAIILVHHTKKGTQNQRLNSDMQSGAGALTDLADGDFFLGRSTQNKNYRLLRRLKSRSCEEQDDATLLYMNPETLWFELKEESVNESEHISFENRDAERAKQIEEMKVLYASGQTVDEIAQIFNVNKSTVSRRLSK
jgi:hypothetical protein